MKNLISNSKLDDSEATTPINENMSFFLSDNPDFEVILNKKIYDFIYDELNGYFRDNMGADDIDFIASAMREFIEKLPNP